MRKKTAPEASRPITPNATRQRRRGRHVQRGPWEPTARDMEMFHAYNSGNISYRDLGTAYGITPAVVCETFKKVNAWLFPQFVENIRSEKVMQTESLRHIFHEAMREWERSKRNGVSITEKDIEFGESKLPAVEKSTTTKGQCGDPRYLAEARAALEDIRRLWGMNAPVQLEFSGELRVAGKSAEEANRELIERLDQVRGRLLTVSAN